MQFDTVNLYDWLESGDIALTGITGTIPEEYSNSHIPTQIPTTLGNIDKKLAQAAIDVLTSGSLTPLIKEELKTKIQAQRLKSGKEELTVFFEEEKKCELRDDEKERMQKRKEANRLAAIRFRRKRKSQELQQVEECTELERKNTKLLKKIVDLEEEKQQLLDMISSIRSPP
ncbi:hypothetical protein LOTGIDRAFT_164399 [Lottia gigantea]|uniref:BZIP domain-containing protein n=1 Tax=Lottia gigantea TaxID=225164 RepID=V4A516_LOTGI|nr:hypothetical protein LOTGIDRAFT_164399 [Lottia gigantea]ESO90095.1 hypothetical protein LOTGIDRAFT_164399 [Lottia gigantea]